MIRNIPPAQTPIVGNEPVSRSWYDYLLWVADQINGLETTGSGSAAVIFSQTDVVLGRASEGGGPGEEIAFTAFARALADDNSFAEMRETLSLGTMALQDADDVEIEGGVITGITDLAVADGGTGASTTTEAFDNLSPLTTTGDLLYHDGVNNVRLGVGSEGQAVTVVSGVPAWGDVSTDDYYAEPLTTGDPADPEIIFDGNGDVISVLRLNA